MSTSKEFVEYITEMCSSLGQLQVARMFGGALLKVDGNQLGVIINEVVYFKVFDPELQKKYQQNGSEQFTYTRKDKKEPVVIKNWWTISPDALDDGQGFIVLAEEVLAQY